MHQFLSCPKCQARLRAPANTTQTQVRCGACGHVFAVEGPKEEELDAIRVEDEPKEVLDALPAVCSTCWPWRRWALRREARSSVASALAGSADSSGERSAADLPWPAWD